MITFSTFGEWMRRRKIGIKLLNKIKQLNSATERTEKIFIIITPSLRVYRDSKIPEIKRAIIIENKKSKNIIKAFPFSLHPKRFNIEKTRMFCNDESEKEAISPHTDKSKNIIINGIKY